MSRTTEEIIVTMDNDQASQPDLADLNSSSSTAIYTLWKSVIAFCINYLEQLWDAKQDDIETSLTYGAPQSLLWLRSKAFEFQYGDTISMSTDITDPYYLVPKYATIDTTKQIITRCVVSQSAGVAYVHVAKNTPPEKLTGGEVSAIEEYYTAAGDGTNQAIGIAAAGQVVTIKTFDPDLLFLEATIYYAGAFAATIQADCIAAIEAYISNLGTTPTFRTTDLVNALKEVDGFVDINFVNLSARDAATAWLSGTDLIAAGVISDYKFETTAGYMIGETTATFTFSDKITFTAI